MRPATMKKRTVFVVGYWRAGCAKKSIKILGGGK